MCINVSGTPGWKTLRTTKVEITLVHISHCSLAVLFTREKFPLELPCAVQPSTLKGCVGTLKDTYVHDVSLPQVPQIQKASPMMSHESIAHKADILLIGYLHIPSWILMLPKLCSILEFSQR